MAAFSLTNNTTNRTYPSTKSNQRPLFVWLFIDQDKKSALSADKTLLGFNRSAFNAALLIHQVQRAVHKPAQVLALQHAMG